MRLQGDEDDHLRAVVLIAGALAQRGADEAVDACRRAAQNPWNDRRRALIALLSHVGRAHSGAPLVTVFDPDALAPRSLGEHAAWDDTHFVQQHGEFLDALVDHGVGLGVVRLERPHPDAAVEQALARRSIASDAVATTPLHEVAPEVLVAPALAPVARWLLEERVFDLDDLREVVRDRCEGRILDAAWSHLRPSAQRDAMRISVVRNDLHRNGTLGPFQWAPNSENNALSVAPAAFEQLTRMGFLVQAHTGANAWVMPRPIRAFVTQHAQWHIARDRETAHRALASTAIDGASDEAVVEAHWHAVEAGDLERAESTAKFYGADLRRLAIELGQRANDAFVSKRATEANDLYARAAATFERIVERFDPSDAYAWEYAAYNRWQPHRPNPQGAPLEIVTKVRIGFARACEASPGNPLYRGRLLAFEASLATTRAEQAAIEQSLATWINTFAKNFALSPKALTWLVEPVLRASGATRRSLRASETVRSRAPAYEAILREIDARTAKDRDAFGVA